MRFGDLVRLVLANLNRMRGRVVMTALGVVIGTAAIVILIALASGLQRSALQSFEDFGPINHITVFSGGFFGGESSEELTPAVLREFEDIDGVIGVTPLVSYSGFPLLKFNRLEATASIYGIDPLVAPQMGLDAVEGTIRLNRATVVVGARVAESFEDPRQRAEFGGPRGGGVRVETSGPGGPASATDEEDSSSIPDLYGQTILLEQTRYLENGETEQRTVRLRVGGVLEEIGGETDYAVYMSLDDMESLITWINGSRPNWNQNGYDQVTVIADLDPQVVLQVESEIINRGFTAFSAGSALQGINTVFLIIQAVLGGIGAIALLVAAIGIANTMIMSVLERTREIGLMKALGATNRDVMFVFISEAGMIGILGGVMGVVVGFLAAKLIDLIAISYIMSQNPDGDVIEQIAYIPLWLPIFAIVFSMIIGLASGIYPALRAVQLDPVRALKYE